MTFEEYIEYTLTKEKGLEGPTLENVKNYTLNNEYMYKLFYTQYERYIKANSAKAESTGGL